MLNEFYIMHQLVIVILYIYTHNNMCVKYKLMFICYDIQSTVQKQIQCTNDITAIHTFCIFSVCYILYGYSVGIIIYFYLLLRVNL